MTDLMDQNSPRSSTFSAAASSSSVTSINPLNVDHYYHVVRDNRNSVTSAIASKSSMLTGTWAPNPRITGSIGPQNLSVQEGRKIALPQFGRRYTTSPPVKNLFGRTKLPAPTAPYIPTPMQVMLENKLIPDNLPPILPPTMAGNGSRLSPLALPSTGVIAIVEAPSRNDRPPPVIPYSLSTTQSRPQRSPLNGCCYCKEPLDITLSEESVVTLKCSHKAHALCYKDNITILNGFDETMAEVPNCFHCDSPAQPESHGIYDTLIPRKVQSHIGSFLSSMGSLPVRNLISQGYVTPGRSNSEPSVMGPPARMSHVPSVRPRNSASNTISYTPIFGGMKAPKNMFSGFVGEIPPALIQTPSIMTPITNAASNVSTSPESLRSSKPTSTSTTGYSDLSQYSITEESRRLKHGSPPFRSTRHIPAPRPPLPIVSTEAEAESIQVGQSSTSPCLVTSVVTISIPPTFFSDQKKYRTTSEDLQCIRKINMNLSMAYLQKTGIDILSLGFLRLYDDLYISRDPYRLHWRKHKCYLFQKGLILISQQNVGASNGQHGKTRTIVVATFELGDKVESVTLVSEKHNVLNLTFFSKTNPLLFLSSEDPAVMDAWHTALLVDDLKFPVRDNMTFGHHRSWMIANMLPLSPRFLAKAPVDLVVALPMTASAHHLSKYAEMKNIMDCLLHVRNKFDRVALVLYSSDQHLSTVVELERQEWETWEFVLDKIRASGITSPFNDVQDALVSSCRVLMNRKIVNPAACVYLVNDAGSRDIDVPVYEDITTGFSNANISVHTFGVGSDHDPDVLADISARTKGTYFYCRKWADVGECIISRYRADQKFLLRNVHADISIAKGRAGQAYITDVTDCNLTIDSASLRTGQAQPSNTRGIQRTSSGSYLIDVGNLRAGEQRSYLIQTSLEPSQLDKHLDQSKIDLFSVRLACEDFQRSTSLDSVIPHPAITPKQDEFSLVATSQVCIQVVNDQDAGTGTPTADLEGDLCMTSETFDIPIFLAPSIKQSLLVAHRRILLFAAYSFEAALVDVARSDGPAAIKTLQHARVLIRGMLEAVQMSSSVHDSEMLQRTGDVVRVLDRDLSIICERAIGADGFTEDTRPWVIQTIGVLRSENGFTVRSQIEELFFKFNEDIEFF